MHGLPVSKYTKYGRLELVAIEWQVEIYKTNIQHPACAVSQRYGVISLVNSPLSTNNIAHAQSSIFKHKLNQMGSNRTNNKWDQLRGIYMHGLTVSK